MNKQSTQPNEKRRLLVNWIPLGFAFLCGFSVARFTDHHMGVLVAPPETFANRIPDEPCVSTSNTLPTLTLADTDDTRQSKDSVPIDWPTKVPRELFGAEKFESCKVVFRDPTMATCHLGAFNGNFGDMLGPDITKRILEYRFGCSADQLPVVDFETQNSTEGPCLWTVGSVFRNVRAHDHVWGTGSHGKWKLEFTSGPCGQQTSIPGKRTPPFNNITIYSVRGPQTAEMVKEYCIRKVQTYQPSNGTFTVDISKLADAGDAGFLVAFLFPELGASRNSTPTMNSCIIAHKYDEQKFRRQWKINSNAHMLPVIQPWRSMVNNISQCEVVSSSSLHGLIVADAFGIPSRWIHENKFILKFKFIDYFRSIGFASKEVAYQPRLKEILMSHRIVTTPSTLSYNQRSAYAQKILATFPYHLFEAKPI